MEQVNILHVDAAMAEKILHCLGTTEEKMRQDVATIREWLKTQPHLPEILDDHRIRNFLILNKCEIEKAMEKIDNNYTIRSTFPDIFEKANPALPNIQRNMEIIYYVPLPKLTEGMYRVIFTGFRNFDLVNFVEPRDVASGIFNLQELRLGEDLMLGDIIIGDMKGFTLAAMMKFIPLLPKMVAIYHGVYSIRLKSVYIINSPTYVTIFLKVLKCFVSTKIYNRIHICRDSSSVLENLPKEILPKNLGGDELSLEELEHLLEDKYRKSQARFDQLDQMRVNEDLRPKLSQKKNKWTFWN